MKKKPLRIEQIVNNSIVRNWSKEPCYIKKRVNNVFATWEASFGHSIGMYVLHFFYKDVLAILKI